MGRRRVAVVTCRVCEHRPAGCGFEYVPGAAIAAIEPLGGGGGVRLVLEVGPCNVLYCTVLYCYVMYCNAMQCNVIYGGVRAVLEAGLISSQHVSHTYMPL